jgi:hypothetical protein
MSDNANVVARVRAANPVPGTPALEPPAELLRRIASGPRSEPARRRTARVQRPLLAALVTLLVAAGLAIAANFSVRYFVDSGSASLPDPVRKELVRAAAHIHPTDSLTLADTVTAYAFTSGSGRGTVYMAPYAHKPGFCAALAVIGKPVKAGCALGGTLATVTGNGLQPWDFSLTPEMHALLGRLGPAAAGDTVQIAFEDGTTDDLPMRGRWFAYAVAGERTRAGHRPRQLSVLRGDREIRRIPLEPVNFNTLAAARALVPAADGSRGQRAVRRLLLGNLESAGADGGLLASHTDIGQTRRLATLAFAHGLRLSVYATPVRPFSGWRAGGALLIALDNRSERPVYTGLGASSSPAAAFWGATGGSLVVPGSPQARFRLLYGDVPRGSASVGIRTADGREHPAAVYAGGRSWVWVGRGWQAPQRPVALVGRDASGAVVTTRRLVPAAHDTVR